MQDQFDAHYPSLNVQILGLNEAGQEVANNLVTAGRDLPWLQDVDADHNDQSDVWDESWNVEWRDVVILDTTNTRVAVYNLTTNDLANSANYAALRLLVITAAAANRTAATPWQQRIEPLDVNNDSFISPVDALLVINKLNAEGARQLTAADQGQNYYDSSGDGYLSPIDALRVISHLNRLNRPAALSATVADEAAGEGLTRLSAFAMSAPSTARLPTDEPPDWPSAGGATSLRAAAVDAALQAPRIVPPPDRLSPVTTRAGSREGDEQQEWLAWADLEFGPLPSAVV
jgi:hypothetical protein